MSLQPKPSRRTPLFCQATLPLFAKWFKETFHRVEAVREAKRQIEYDFGQTEALEQHDTEFNELLGKLPAGPNQYYCTG